MRTGETHILFIPPGWLLGGTIDQIEGGEVVLRDAVYIENIAEGHAVMDLALSEGADALKKASGRTWPCPDGTIVRQDAILIAWPCKTNLRSLAKGREMAAIRTGR